MKILAIGSDRSILEDGSEARRRIMEYGALVDELHVVVFVKRQSQISNPPAGRAGLKSQNLGNVFLYPTNSQNRWHYICDAYALGKRIIQNSPKESLRLPTGQAKFKIQNSLITCQDPYDSGPVGWLLKRKFNIPFQLQIHTDIFSTYFRRESFLNKIRFLMAKFLIPRADCIRVVSARIKKSIISSFKFQVSRIPVFPIYVDVERIMDVPIMVNLRQKYPRFDFIILIASRLTKEKNIKMAVEAMAEVVKRYPKMGLIIVGGGIEKPKLKLQVTSYKLQENIIFEEWQSQEILVSYYKTADLFLITSNYEGYGRTAIEAMAANCPVIMTDVGLANEILKNEVNGLVIPVGDKKKLTEAILKIIENKELREVLRQNALETVKSFPLKQEYLKQYKSLWENCFR